MSAHKDDMTNSASRLPEIMTRHEKEILSKWTAEIKTTMSRQGVVNDTELASQTADFLRLLRTCLQAGGGVESDAGPWSDLRQLVTSISRARGLQGFSPSETASFVFALKRPLFDWLRAEIKDSAELGEEIWRATELLDRLGLMTTEAYQKAREEVIARQQQDLLELSTPVVKLWDGVLALPMIGTLDSARTQVVMETLLQRIVETGSDVAIIDITGVPTVDTLVAQHLLKTVTAARLMGADCIISGIRPQIAQTIVHLGVELGNVTTKASLADAFAITLQRRGITFTRGRGGAGQQPQG
jgi:rsbT co-antagonist protein RsbR